MFIPGDAGFAGLATRALACSGLQAPSTNGTNVLSFSAEAQTRYTPGPLFAPYITAVLGVSTLNISFCQVTMSYTHPGQNDTVNLQLWLPELWNGRFQGTGGSGWRGGIFDLALLPAIAEGYAAASTDAGHSIVDTGVSTWALKSPGNVDLPALQDFGSVALNELAIFGKALTENFYGKPADYSYWNGCSQGGRQGMMLAQRYPEAFDGIVAGAPAINWNPLMGSLYHPQAVLNALGNSRPSNCEFEAITAAAIEACDGLDGVYDTIISRPELCKFDPFSVVGRSSTCGNGTTVTISEVAATVANATWSGVTNQQGRQIYPGLTYDAPLTSTADTDCVRTGNCSDTAWALGAQWFQYFVQKNASFDITSITPETLPGLVHEGVQQYDSFLGTNDPDLTNFKKAGGKLLSWHGIADDYIPVGGSTQYYDQVAALDADVQEYFKLFLAPGVHHCSGGPGAYPSTILLQLTQWVENGTAPNTLLATGTQLVNGTLLSRDLCPYPAASIYEGGNVTEASSYRCSSPDA